MQECGYLLVLIEFQNKYKGLQDLQRRLFLLRMNKIKTIHFEEY